MERVEVGAGWGVAQICRQPVAKRRHPGAEAGVRPVPTEQLADLPLPFTSLYLLEDEWAAEIANKTIHGVMHIGWVPDETGGFRAQMAVYVKPNGLLGRAYMAAIRPFRHLIIYPPMLREMGRAWRSDTARHPVAGAPT